MNKLKTICDDLRIFDIKYRDKINLPKNVKFGTEIEFENACYHDTFELIQKKKKLSKWVLKGDATVNTFFEGKDYGGELISPILHDTKESWSQLKTACQLLRHNLALIQGRAGAHIHIDSNILKDDDNLILNLIKLWMVYEHVIYRFAYGEENTMPRGSISWHASPVAPYINEFLLEYDNNNKIYEEIKKMTFMKDCHLYYLFSLYVKNPNAINTGINFHHCKGISDDELNTIEIRCPNGTLNHITWQNNINLFTKLLIYCASSNFDKEFIDKKIKKYKYKRLEQYSDIYFSDAVELANLIFDNELDKMYFFKQYLKINKNNFEIVKEKALKR